MKYIAKILTLSSALILTVFVVPTFANESNNTSLDPNTDTIDQSKIIKVEVKDGKLYIDLLDDSNTSMLFRSAIGGCKTKYKTITKKVSRSDLIKMREEVENNSAISSALFSIITGTVHPILGIASGLLSVGYQSMLKKEIENALFYNSKNSYTMKTKYKCESVDFGSRGTVHRFVLESISIS